MSDTSACYACAALGLPVHNLQQWRSCQQQQLQEQRRRQGRRTASHIVRITGKREEYDIEGLIDPEDIWGEDADQEFIEVRTECCTTARTQLLARKCGEALSCMHCELGLRLGRGDRQE